MNTKQDVFKNEISDYHLLSILQKYLNLPKNYNTSRKLVNIKRCHTGTLFSDVVLMSDSSKAQFRLLLQCGSAWACPHCTPKVMAKKAANLACAIEALKTWYDEIPCMITLTLPHVASMSCETSFSILKNSWRAFSRNGNKNRRKTYTLKLTDGEKNTTGGKAKKNGKKNTKVTYKIKNPYANCRETLQITKSVRVYEFTWGKNGWHPHIHMLWWVPKKNFNKLLQYEEDLSRQWWEIAKRQALKYLNQKYPDKKQDNKDFTENELYTEESYQTHRPLYISKDSNGKIIEQKSSWYITGWSSDMELTGLNVKTARNGNLTPIQILHKAESDAHNKDKWLDLFLEYALATVNHRRMEFSKSIQFSFYKLIEKWKASNPYQEQYKKKLQSKTEQKMWFAICSFPKSEWYKIYLHDVSLANDECPLKTVILLIASRASPENINEIYSELQTFLSEYNIKIYPPDRDALIETAKLNAKLNNYKVNIDTGEIIAA